HNQRSHLENEVVDRKQPLQADAGHIRGIDLVESAMPVSAEFAVIGGPVAFLKTRMPAFERVRNLAYLDSGERGQVGQEAPAIAAGGRRHGGWFRLNARNLSRRQHVEAAVKVLQLEAITVTVPREACDLPAVGERNGYSLISGSEPCRGFRQ